MKREILPFAVDRGRGCNEYKETVLGLSSEVLSACLESLKVPATEIQGFLRSFLDLENYLRCLQLRKGQSPVRYTNDLSRKSGTDSSLRATRIKEDNIHNFMRDNVH